MARAMARPSPAPLSPEAAEAEPRKSFSKTRSSSSAARPGPGRATLTTSPSSSRRALMSIGVPAPLYLSAFSRRLTSTCSTSTPSSGTRGRSGGEVLVHHSPGQFLPQPPERRPDDVLEREPLLLDFDGSGIEPGHAEQVVDQPGQAVGFLDHLVQERLPLRSHRPTRPTPGERCWSRYDGQRGAQIMGHGAEQRAAQALLLDPAAMPPGLVGQFIPLDGRPDLSGKRLQQLPVLGREQGLACRLDARSGPRPCPVGVTIGT